MKKNNFILIFLAIFILFLTKIFLYKKTNNINNNKINYSTESNLDTNNYCINNINNNSGCILGHTSLYDETNIESLPIKGKVPAWISGDLIRNGPAMFETDNKKINNWYDGLAMLHKFSFKNGKISYINRFIEGDNNTNVNITKINNQHVALTETPSSVIFDPETLKTINTFIYKDKLPTEKIFESAHPHIDEDKKEIINYMVHFGYFNSSYNIYKIPFGTKERKIISSISVKEPSFMHSFGVTENYIILIEFPFVVKPADLLFVDEYIDQYKWKPERGTNFYIINRATGKLIEKYSAQPFFAFHIVNSFEDEHNNIIIDLVEFKDISVINHTKKIENKIKQKSVSEVEDMAGKLTRYKIDLKNNNKKNITKTILSAETVELPRINEEYLRKPYKYIYSAGLQTNNSNELNQLVKIDLKTNQIKIWKDDLCYPGEPVFVKGPDKKNEDDGIILSLVLDAKKRNSFILILDANEFNELARAELPHHVPFGFHGHFYSKEKHD